MSPSKSEKYCKHDFFSAFNEEINFYKNKGIVIVQGDLNARTGNAYDFIKHDKFDDAFGIENYSNHLLRNSEDQIINSRGKELLDVCKLNDFLIANGHSIGDIFGKFTSHQWNGSSVTDYLLFPNNFSNKISEFTVGNFVPWISDHCPIHSTILLNEVTSLPKQQDSKLLKTLPSFILDANSQITFRDALTSQVTKDKINQLIASENMSAINIAAEIKNILLTNAQNCHIKMKKNPKPNSKQSAPWFDKECIDIKDNLRKLGSSLKKEPCNNILRSSLSQQKKLLKKLTTQKKYRYKKGILNEMANNYNNKNQKDFWKLLDKLSQKKPNISNYIKHDTLSSHFRSLLNTKGQVNLPPDSKERGPLDGTITLEELEIAAAILKPGKALGIDSVSNEMISCLLQNYPQIILKLFNTILNSNEIVPEWLVAIIAPIHKSGSKTDASNYRGISLLCALGKFFLSILNNRLMKFTIENNILSRNQLGFLPGNRTSDAHIITYNLIRKYCHKKQSRIYSCFIDFSKAFDTIPRDILLNKLLNLNITGKFFNIIKSIYSNDKACIKIGSELTECFPISQGVRQGCVLSPLLFNIFMSDLAKKLEPISGKLKLEPYNIDSLIWADDILLFAENEKNLQDMIDTIDRYCKDNKLTINTDKTKCMIFNKTGRLLRNKFYLGDTELENVRSYKYLGFLFSPSGEINSGLQDLRDRALKAFMKLKIQMGTSFNQNIDITLKLIDSLIKPILLYSSDFWGCLKLPKDNPIEKLHISMYKQILGVQKQTTNIGVLLELGRIPLEIFARKMSIKNWERIRLNQANDFLLASYNDAMLENLPWISKIKDLLESKGMLSLYITRHETKPPFVHKKILQTLTDEFHQNSFESIRNEKSKLRTYAKFKTEIGQEKYLSNIKNPSIRKVVTKFRLSNHTLLIETGRHKNIPKDRRFCPFCPKTVETELHFLLECPCFNVPRSPMVEYVARLNPSYQHYSSYEKFRYLLSNSDHREIYNYISNAFKIRTFLIARPKMTM